MKNDGNKVRSVELNDNSLENVSGGATIEYYMGHQESYTVYTITDKDGKVVLETESISEAINYISENPGSKMKQETRNRIVRTHRLK